jgi:hypothetical protein
MSLIVNTTWKCPKGKGNGTIDFDLQEVYILEQRKNQIGQVTKVTAPDLMQAFERGYSTVGRFYNEAEAELADCRMLLEKRKAIVATDIAPDKLKAKGLTNAKNPAGSVDLREAIVAQDDEYLALVERRDAIEAMVGLLKIKMRGFEMAYQSVKKVFDSLSGLNNPSMDAEASPDSPDNITSNSFIGKARY